MHNIDFFRILNCFFFFLIREFRLYKQGAVSLIAMNLHTDKEVGVKLEKSLQGLDVDEHLFTPDGDITSRFAVFK